MHLGSGKIEPPYTTMKWLDVESVFGSEDFWVEDSMVEL